jgi:hypothetical protein
LRFLLAVAALLPDLWSFPAAIDRHLHPEGFLRARDLWFSGFFAKFRLLF